MTPPSNPADRQKLKLALEQITDSMARAAAERDHIKEVIDMIKENFEIDPKQTRKLAKTMYDRSFTDLQQENEDFELLYESVVEGMAVVSDVEESEEERKKQKYNELHICD